MKNLPALAVVAVLLGLVISVGASLSPVVRSPTQAATATLLSCVPKTGSLWFRIEKKGDPGSLTLKCTSSQTGNEITKKWTAGSGNNVPADKCIKNTGPIPSGGATNWDWDVINQETNSYDNRQGITKVLPDERRGFPIDYPLGIDPTSYCGTGEPYRDGLFIHEGGNTTAGCIAMSTTNYLDFKANIAACCAGQRTIPLDVSYSGSSLQAESTGLSEPSGQVFTEETEQSECWEDCFGSCWVGGIAEAPDLDASPLDTAGSSSPPYVALAGAGAAIVVIGAGGWYARRRYSVRRR